MAAPILPRHDPRLRGQAHTVASRLTACTSCGTRSRRTCGVVIGFGFQQGIVKVSVTDVRVEHQVKLSDFTQWLEKPVRIHRENDSAPAVAIYTRDASTTT